MSCNGPVSSGDLFVFYGLLKQGAAGMPAKIDLEGGGAFRGPCRFRGDLYDLGGYPGAVAGNTLCHGVRYCLDKVDLIAALDAFEDVLPDDPEASLYKRIKIAVLDDAGQDTSERAWIYWYNQSISGCARLADGNWPLDSGRARKIG